MTVKVYVGNLSRKTTAEELALVFAQFGQITDYTILKDHVTGESRGIGFVTFQEFSNAVAAIETMNETTLVCPIYSIAALSCASSSHKWLSRPTPLAYKQSVTPRSHTPRSLSYAMPFPPAHALSLVQDGRVITVNLAGSDEQPPYKYGGYGGTSGATGYEGRYGADIAGHYGADIAGQPSFEGREAGGQRGVTPPGFRGGGPDGAGGSQSEFGDNVGGHNFGKGGYAGLS
ncbi:hypothetical protein JCM10908_004948 [Rhodotorula pacifica]|uniref:uncharacterized protein n=1 Tax=Rhodotorula pacifica TaxID=1495444 RepID=UPI00317C2990